MVGPTRLLALKALLAGGTVLSAAEPSTLRFNRDVRPILADNCFACHGPDANSRDADLRLDDEQSAKEDRGGYRVIAAGVPGESALIERITSADTDERMPPADSGKELSRQETDVLHRWIQQGATYEAHWSLSPLRRPQVPDAGPSDWAATEIDRFLARRWRESGVAPVGDADPVVLVRRIYLDLTGLPPTPAQVDAFADRDSASAYQDLVDRLLKSPHYGERMAMYWMDLVRYADSVGYHGDQVHNITPYRDYIIKAFHDNMPFDRFTVEQLAGDLLPDATIDQKIASGYNRVLQTSHEGGVQVKEYLAKYAADRVRNLAAVWMGATLGCAECHDHKYDPYTQRDFYRLAAFFADIDDLRSFDGSNLNPTKRAPEIEVLSPLDRHLIEGTKREIERVEALASGSVGQGHLEQLRQRQHQLRERRRKTMITESIEPRVTRVLERGDWMDASGEIVQPDVPDCVLPMDVHGRRATRLDLARWLTRSDHPQTARVFVNRLWYLLFGAGISPSLADGGAQGAWPRHPELLDYLASQFVGSGWDVKHVVRLIVSSRVYRLSSIPSPQLARKDPDNHLFARQNRFRLPAETIRDVALVVSGALADDLGGPSARPYQPEGYYAHLNFPKRTYQASADRQQYRRGVYMHWQRQFLHPMLRAFDAPTREQCTAQRPISNTPLAALTMLNDPTFVEAARGFAERIMREGGSEDEQKLRWAWCEAFSRQPEPAELEIARQLLQAGRQRYKTEPDAAQRLLSVGLMPRDPALAPAELAGWTSVARMLLNTNELITRN